MQKSDENKKKYQLWDYLFIQHQILQINKINITWQTVRRITNAILGVKGLSWLLLQGWVVQSWV